MTTVYSFHRADTHRIIDTAVPANLRIKAAKIAERINGKPHNRTVYVHNGLGVVAVGFCRDGVWQDSECWPYMVFDDQARAERESAYLDNDERKERGA